VAGILALVLAGLMIVTLVPVLVGGLDGFTRSTEARRQMAQRAVMRLDRFRCLLRSPGTSWAHVNPRKYGAGPIVAFDRSDFSFTLAVVSLSPAMAEPLDHLIQLSKAGIRDEAKEYKLLSEGQKEVQGVSGWEIRTRAIVGGKDYYFDQWLTASNDFGYQLSLWGPAARESDVQEEAERVFTCLEILPKVDLSSSVLSTPPVLLK
jgi:hypothetical protein